MFLVAILLVCTLPISTFAVQHDDIIILYENDVHCELEGYCKGIGCSCSRCCSRYISST